METPVFLAPILRNLRHSSLGLIALGMMGSFSAIAQSSNGHDLTTDMGIQEATFASQLGQMNASYDAQIAAQKAAIQRAQAQIDQCNAQTEIQALQTKQQQSAARVQSLAPLFNSAPQAVGAVVDRMSAGVADKKVQLDADIAATNDEIRRAKSQNKVTVKGDGSVTAKYDSCQKHKDNELAATDPTAELRHSMQYQRCEDSIRNLARDLSDQRREQAQRQQQIKQANSHLVSSGAVLAAQGLSGVLMNELTAKPLAKSQGKVGEINKQMCLQQANFGIADAQRRLQQLEKERAQGLLDANIAKAARDLALARAAEERLPTGVVSAGGVAPKSGFVPKGPAANGLAGGGAVGGGGGGAGGGGAGAGSTQWGFGGDGGGEEPGGSPLPKSPASATFSGTAMAASGGGESGFGGFGGANPAEQDIEGPSPASVDGEYDASLAQINGDGGLNVLLNRMRLIHARHAVTLLQSQDLSEVATGIPSASNL